MDQPTIEIHDAICQAETALIRYPRFNEQHREIQRCQSLSRIAGEPQCMSLEGVTGAGKSTLARDYAATFPRRETEDGVTIPVFYAEIPSPATVKGTAAALLEQMGDPLAGKGTLWGMNSRLVKLIQACGVELVILDEFSNLIDTETHHVLASVSNWLKMLIKQTSVPFLVIGLDGKVDCILHANPQLSRLFAAREKLLPFTWDVQNRETIQEFNLFVSYAEKAVELPLSADVPRVELLYRVFYATNGVVGNVMNLLRYATMVACEKGISQMTLADLAIAFEKRLGQHLRTKKNPFMAAANERFAALEDERITETVQQSRRARSVASALTTR